MYFLLLFALIRPFHCQPINIVSTGEFSLHNGRHFALPNVHRDQEPELHFTLAGSQIDVIGKKNATVRTFKFMDGGELDFQLENPIRDATLVHIDWKEMGANASQREVCFHIGGQFTNPYWYSSHQSNHPNWPLNINKSSPLQSFNCLNYAENREEPFQNILEHLYVSTEGFAIVLDRAMPLFVRFDPDVEGNPSMCISVKRELPYSGTADLGIKFHILSSRNIAAVTQFAVHGSGVLPRPTGLPDEDKLTSPSWSTWPQYEAIDQPQVERYSQELDKHGYPGSEILLTSYWRIDNYREFRFDPDLYPSPRRMLTSLHDREFRLGVYVNPFVNDGNWQTEDYFFDAGYHNSELNATKPEAAQWFSTLLERMHINIGVDSYAVIPYVNFCDKFSEPNQHVTAFIETVAAVPNVTSSSIWAFRTQHLPMITQLFILGSNYSQILSNLVPNVLQVSIAGYSFISANPIGYPNHSAPPNSKPSEELYIRWVQACAFMPSMTFTLPPWSYSSVKLNRLTKKFVDFHMHKVPLLMNLARKRIRDGHPIIRPLWYTAPDDPATYEISDQFMVGNDIVVAPVLIEGQFERKVYLPAGLWLDQHGNDHKGGKWIVVPAPLEELPWFVRPCSQASVPFR